MVWKDDAPTYEDYLTKKQAAEEAQRTLMELERYQVETLGTARETLTKEKEPASRDQIAETLKDMEERAPEVLLYMIDDGPQDSPAVSAKSAIVPDLR